MVVTMSSVTARIAEVKQPRGGYIKPSQFVTQKLENNMKLNENENIHGIIIGLTVDYLTRYMMGSDPFDAFNIPLLGAKIAENIFQKKKAIAKAILLLSNINGLTDYSIINACKLTTYDVWLRNPIGAISSKTADEINPDESTIQNIRVLVQRCLYFWNIYGPIIKEGFTFGPNGYTKVVDSGDGDYLTADTLWDFKVSKSRPTSKHTLQLLMYWIMGLHSGQAEFTNINKLGFFNPRLNEVYLLNTKDIPTEIIEIVEKDIICY